ncbi:MAG: YceI family protein, partial [Gammaproteobacteria bacterium]
MTSHSIPASRTPISRISGFGVLALILMLLAGCQTTAGLKPQAALAPLPSLNTQGALHYLIRPDLSDVRFLVYRAGPLASFGHNHVIRAANIQGDIYLGHDLQHSGFTLTLPVADFKVDEPAARAVEGADFTAQPSPQAIQGTGKNMLGPAGLDAAEYPDIRIRSVRFVGPDWGPDATVRIDLHGIQRDMTLPIALEHAGDRLIATGTFEIRQSDFGIKPFSIL